MKLASLENGKYFFAKKVFLGGGVLLISYLFSSCGGVHKSVDENLVTLDDANLKLASIMPF